MLSLIDYTTGTPATCYLINSLSFSRKEEKYEQQELQVLGTDIIP